MAQSEGPHPSADDGHGSCYGVCAGIVPPHVLEAVAKSEVLAKDIRDSARDTLEFMYGVLGDREHDADGLHHPEDWPDVSHIHGPGVHMPEHDEHGQSVLSGASTDASGAPTLAGYRLNDYSPEALAARAAAWRATFADLARQGHSNTAPHQMSDGPKRRVYDLENQSRSLLPGKLRRSDADDTGATSAAAADPVVNDAFDGLGSVWRFFAEHFHQDSFDNRGAALLASVHVERALANAFWNRRQMAFGDGNALLRNFHSTLDIVGHELAHAVVQYSSGLRYRGASGALNEHCADVFACLLEQWRARQTPQQANWLVGEECVWTAFKGIALRSMKAPGTAYSDPVLGKDPQPDHMSRYRKLPETPQHDMGGVHINSGIPNRAFYLFATAFDSPSWEGPGWIWYCAMLNAKPDSTFEQFAALTLKYADIAGAAYHGPLKAAWVKVGVLKEEAETETNEKEG